ncbi:curlin repeat-containing protein [Hymenobacter endophyticus]|uniref:Curlin repeat-containing protein n=1 Tax=Hymenobacter endophyticus TaxID=3076335 RepID=A0ABU3TJA1_9BACT|nr:curlin repeat-containing protein [Hymenobacter endophyticus]MDU0371441.1 curlin repeat-containing protein [Hymenobacter endophyticus]
MKTKWLILTSLLLCCAATASQAQTSGEDNPVPSLVLLQNAGAELNAAVAPALPLINKVMLTQVGSGNQATLLQTGVNNTIIASQTGNQNVQAVAQSGTSNTINTTIVGNGTTSTIKQNGAYNSVEQELRVDSRRYLVQQMGTNNQLVQREAGATAPPGYEIKMQGNGIRLSIEQGSVYKP